MFCYYTGPLCKDIRDWLDTTEPSKDDSIRYYVALSHSAGASAVKSLLHFAQNMNQDRFQDYSVNFHETQETREIPIENIHQIPILLIAGKHDKFADLTDAQWTFDRIS